MFSLLRAKDMLVLTRKEGQKLFIGKDVVVHVHSVKGKQVRLAIEAPKNYVITRQEVKDKGST